MGGMTRVIIDRRAGHDIAEAARRPRRRRRGRRHVVDGRHPRSRVRPTCRQWCSCTASTAQSKTWPLDRSAGCCACGASRHSARNEAAHCKSSSARADLDPVRGTPPVRHVGAVWQGVPRAAQPQPVPQLLVSLSTCAFAGQRRMLQNILDAVESLPVRATVTVGPAIDASGLRVPDNASIHSWLDHDEVLATASLVISHGGHSTAMRALSFGVPLVIMPANALIDQKRVGIAVQQAGAGHAAAQARQCAPHTCSGQRCARRSHLPRSGHSYRRTDPPTRGAAVAADVISEFARTSSSR